MSAFLLSTQILYTGLLVDLSRSAGGGGATGGSPTGGSATGGGATGGSTSGAGIDTTSTQVSHHWFSSLPVPSGKELSIFYWGCNVLYWNELSGQTAFTTSITPTLTMPRALT